MPAGGRGGWLLRWLGGQLGALIWRVRVTPAARSALGVGALWDTPPPPFPVGLGYASLRRAARCPLAAPQHRANICNAVGIPCPTTHAAAPLSPRPDPIRATTRGPDTRINEFPKRGGPGEGRIPAQEKALNWASRGQSGPGRPTARPYARPHLLAHSSAAHRESDPIPGDPLAGVVARGCVARGCVARGRGRCSAQGFYWGAERDLGGWRRWARSVRRMGRLHGDAASPRWRQGGTRCDASQRIE